MIGFGGVLTDEEIWAIIQYEQSFAGDHGPGRGMGPAMDGRTGTGALDVRRSGP